jgi:hypothetical protein
MLILVSPIVSFEFSVRADWFQRNRLGKIRQAMSLEIKGQQRLQARLPAMIKRPSAVIDADGAASDGASRNAGNAERRQRTTDPRFRDCHKAAHARDRKPFSGFQCAKGDDCRQQHDPEIP